MRRSIRSLALAAAAGGCLSALGVITAPGASGETAPRSTPAEEHCVLRVTGRADDGRLLTDDLVCAATRMEALDRSAALRAPTATAAAADWAIGTHYDGPSYTGSSLTVVGADCTGGWLNMPAGWNNRISSTRHGCPRIRHCDGYYLSTPQQTTVAPGSNLFSLDNRTSSIQYLP